MRQAVYRFFPEVRHLVVLFLLQLHFVLFGRQLHRVCVFVRRAQCANVQMFRYNVGRRLSNI